MKVQATKRGYADHQIREPGDEFEIPDEPKGKDGKPAAFSARWMKPAKPKKAEEQDDEVVETAPQHVQTPKRRSKP